MVTDLRVFINYLHPCYHARHPSPKDLSGYVPVCVSVSSISVPLFLRFAAQEDLVATRTPNQSTHSAAQKLR